MTFLPRASTSILTAALFLCVLTAAAFAEPGGNCGGDGHSTTSLLQPGEPAGPFARKVLEGARREVANRTRYGATDYRRIGYPGGDVPKNVGVCTDLIVRAFRHAGVDLQKNLHEDRLQHRSRYPTHNWINGKADSNIDHRRCSNLAPYFAEFAERRSKDFEGKDLEDWRGGDVVFFVRERQKHPWHVGVVSDRRTPEGIPYIVHLFPDFAAEEPIVYFTPVHSRFRWKETSAKTAKAERDVKPTGRSSHKRLTSPSKIQHDTGQQSAARNQRDF